MRVRLLVPLAVLATGSASMASEACTNSKRVPRNNGGEHDNPSLLSVPANEPGFGKNDIRSSGIDGSMRSELSDNEIRKIAHKRVSCEELDDAIHPAPWSHQGGRSGLIVGSKDGVSIRMTVRLFDNRTAYRVVQYDAEKAACARVAGAMVERASGVGCLGVSSEEACVPRTLAGDDLFGRPPDPPSSAALPACCCDGPSDDPFCAPCEP
jgi:hypothetical protein